MQFVFCKFYTGYLLGLYKVHIGVENTTTSLATQYKAFELPGVIKQHQTAKECNKVMSGDTVIVKKKNGWQTIEIVWSVSFK